MTDHTHEMDISEVIDRQKRSSFQLSIIFWLFLIMLVEGFDNQILAYAAPAIMEELQLSKSLFGIVFASGLVGYVVGALALGNLADRYGRRPMVMAGLLTIGISSLMTVFCTSAYELMAVRFMTGIGLGAIIPVADALAVEFAPKNSRSTRVAINYLGHLAGASGGGLLAAATISHFGWTGVFWLGGILPILLSIVLIFVLPESPTFMLGKPEQKRRLLTLLKKLSPDVGLNEETRLYHRDERQPGMAVKHLFTQGRALTTPILWIAFLGSYATQHFLTNWLPTVLVTTGLVHSKAIVAASLTQFGAAVGGLLVARAVDRYGTKVLGLTYLFGVALIAAIGLVPVGHDTLLMVMIFLVGVVYFGGVVNLIALSTILYPTYIRSTGIGWAAAVGRGGSLIGVTTGGFLLAANVGGELLFLLVALPGLVCACAIFILAKLTRSGALSGSDAA